MKVFILFLAFVSFASAINYHGCTLAPDGLSGWVVAIDTVLILHTTDGGVTWTYQQVPTDTSGRLLFDVTCYGTMKAWTAGKHNLHSAEILYTSDAGDNWVRQIAGFSKYGTRIEMYDSTYGISVGGDGLLVRTTDGGTNWEQIFTDWYEAEYYGVSIINQYDSWICAGWPDSVVTGQGYIVTSNDGGIIWDTLNGYHAAGYEDFFDIHFFNVLEGLVVGGTENNYSALVWRTTNGGTTWNPVSLPPSTYYLRAVDFVELEGWAVGKSGTIIHTTDGGNTWSTQTSPSDTTLFDVDFSDHDHGLACGYNYILRTTNGGQTWEQVGIEEYTAALPTTIEFSVSPNPFTAATNIRFTIHDTRSTINRPGLSIYDASGRLVKSFDPASCIMDHESVVLWDGTDHADRRLPPGIYFARLETGSNAQAVKLVLLE